MKFAHLAQTYKETFERNDNGQRVANPANSQDVILSQHPEWGRNEYTGYAQYADARIYSGMNHDAAMADVEKVVIWR